MPRAVKASEIGLKPHFKIRIAILGGLLHVASWTEPKLHEEAGRVARVDAQWINNPDYGDVIGYINWREITAITWRWSE